MYVSTQVTLLRHPESPYKWDNGATPPICPFITKQLLPNASTNEVLLINDVGVDLEGAPLNK
jgi:hypothetical protein